MNFQDFYDWMFHQRPDGEGLSLKATGLVVGALLVLGHLWAWLSADKAMAIAKAFPRHRVWGIALLAIGAVWSYFLVSYMDMGEFFTWRRWLVMLLPVTFVLVITYVPEFLAVRALGALLLLAASPLLHAAFLQPQTSRLLVPILAYVWVLGGMFFVGMPYLLRDAITWATQNKQRWNMAAAGGAAYGVLMLVVAAVSW
ncbi:MAG TPA: hypothetical protein VLE43_19470 [Candidatus Saccharimonadia bacterium]|nr:hypothetical protein [Candidatus Saccharimonadia bacterium]